MNPSKRRGRLRKETAAKADDLVILLHFVEDGFTADGAVGARSGARVPQGHR